MALPQIVRIYKNSDFMIQWQLADGYTNQEFKFTLYTNDELENGWVASYIAGVYRNCMVEGDKVNIYVDSTHKIKAGCLTIQSEYDYSNSHFADNVETIKDSVKTNIYLVMNGANATSATFLPSNLPDLSGSGDYVTFSDLAAASYITANDVEQMGYITASDVENMGYATESYVAEYVSSYAPEYDMSSYVTKTELNNAGYATRTQLMFKQDALVSGNNIKTINNKSILGSGNLNVVTDLTGYATEAYVQAKIDAIPQTDMSSYVTKSELDAAGYISAIPSEYITQSELSANSYLTSVPSNYATKSYVEQYVAQHSGDVDMSAYVTHTELNNAAYVTNSEVQNILSNSGYVTSNELSNAGYITNNDLQQTLSNAGYITSIPSEYITETELNGMGYVTNSQLQQAAYATESYVQGKIESIPSVDLSSYVTHTELSNAGYLTSIPSEYITETELNGMGYVTPSYIDSLGLSKTYTLTQSEYDALISGGTYDPTTIYIISDATPTDLSYYVLKTDLESASYATQSYVVDYVATYGGGALPDMSAYVTHSFLESQSYLQSIPDTYASKSYVADYVATYAPTPDMSSYLTYNQFNTYIDSLSYAQVVEILTADYELLSYAEKHNGSIYVLTDSYYTADVVTPSYLETYYATQAYVVDYVATYGGGSMPDMSAYVTHTELSNAGYITSIPSEYITETELNGMGYVTQTYLDTYYYSKSYVDTYFVSKAELAACGYLTYANFQYDSVNNTLTITI